jgi:hypothetical protein
MKHSSSKNTFWGVSNKKWRKWSNFVSPHLFNNTYGLPMLTMDTTCPNQYFIFDWSIYSLLVLNRSWKRDSLQIMIFVYVCSTWGMVELKTRFETWITRNDVNGVSLYHLLYLITLMAYLCSQLTPNVQMKYFMFECSICRLFVLNTGWKRDSLQMMIFVKICSSWRMVVLKTCFEAWITWNDVNGVSLFHLSYAITLKVFLCS